ncbi:ATP-binding protein [Streptomyces sp. AC512_CC834]|uniref:ATP-binding protein n=1 Tax=Streptomyces sp. AC512_CC834 TaxID=2823691 RepID=UPI001C26B796|nr:ATP-binding protein [Streptomyces sp. AC512_CC834]
MASTTTHETEAGERLRPTWRPVASATGDPAYTGVLQRDDQAAEDAREMVDMALAVWSLQHLGDDLKVVASELASNAARHARGLVVRMAVTRTARYRVRVAITDTSRDLPKLQIGDLMDESGRGLRLVDALSSNWGVIPLPWGKQVWAEVTAP